MNINLTTETDHLTITGAMSGTSLDGIDLCTISVSTANDDLSFSVIHESSHPFENELKQKLMKLALNQSTTVQEIFETESALTQAYDAAFTEHRKFVPNTIDCLAAHGQTIYHAPSHANHSGTWQLLNGHFLAQKHNMVVVDQFRQADMALGGQGAPLVPKIDDLLFRKFAPAVVLNIGGISNLTMLSNHHPVIAFDCGPGNMIIDDLMRRFYQKDFDTNGIIAKSGKIQLDVIRKTLEMPFFKLNPPKSTGRELFNHDWISEWLGSFPIETPSEDFIATATQLTAEVIHHAVKNFCAETPKTIIVSGGGSQNETMMSALKELFGSDDHVKISDDFGVHSQFKEALAFALLGYLTLTGKPGNLPSVTGAKKETILGAVHFPSKL